MSLTLLLFFFFFLSYTQQVPYCSNPMMYNSTMDSLLISSTDMPAQVVQVNTYIPISTLWAYLSLADFVSWNPLFNSVSTSTFQLCGPLDAVYSNSQFLTPILPTNLNGPHYIIQMGCDPTARNCAFAWWFNLIDNDNGELITYGRHTFSLLQSVVDPGVTIVQSWEKAAGVNVKMNQIPWTNALQESLIDAVTGIVCLERVYQSTGGLDPSDVKNFCTHFDPCPLPIIFYTIKSDKSFF